MYSANLIATLGLVLNAATVHSLSANAILSKSVAALGGKTAIEALTGVSSHAYLFRTTSLEESYVPGFADTFIATAGQQTISYDLSGDISDVIQRIDRAYQISEYWYFGRGELDPINASIVTRSGSTGYSCYVQGNELEYNPPQSPAGYVDPAFANLLLRDATRLNPKLLLAFESSSSLTASNLEIRGVQFPAVTDASLNITVAFDPVTYLPYTIRAYEDHLIYGNSTSDFVVYNYTSVGGVQFPQRIKLYYNEDDLLIDALMDQIEVNPSFPQDFFEGLPESEINETALQFPPSPAMASSEYGIAEVFENTQNFLWYGGYLGKLSNVTVSYPHPQLPNLIHLVFNDSPTYTTTIADMGDAVMVTDAPPHQSKLVIQWIKENLKKDVTHLLVTHHHHDHNYGAVDYVEAGATLVVPETYSYYWSAIPGVKFATVTEDKPFIFRSASMQVRGIWPGPKNVHAADWMYYTFTPRCPDANSLMAIEIADSWSPGLVGYMFNQQLATEWLDIARGDKIPKNNLVIPIHGVPTNASVLYEDTGYDYPNFGILDFVPGGAWC